MSLSQTYLIKQITSLQCRTKPTHRSLSKSLSFRSGPWLSVCLCQQCSMSIHSKLQMAPTCTNRSLRLWSKRRWFQMSRMVWLRCKECMRWGKGPVCQKGFFLRWVRRNLWKTYWLRFWRNSWRVCRRGFFRIRPYRCFYRRWRFFCWFFRLRDWRRLVFRRPRWLRPYIWHRQRFWITKNILGSLNSLDSVLDLEDTSFLCICDTVLVKLTHISDINI